MDKKTIKHIAAFITEDPHEFGHNFAGRTFYPKDRRPLSTNPLDNIEDEYGLGDDVVSSCCAAEIIDGDICSDCREHCDPLGDEEMPDEYRPDQPFEPVPPRFDKLTGRWGPGDPTGQ